MSEAVSGEADSDGSYHNDGRWEYQRLRLPSSVSRPAAVTQLSIHAEYADWELSTVRLYGDGSRRVWLRRRYRPSSACLPGLIT
ncbi:hypothetical protein H0B56_10045 [Haloechinothrix sp. YIM 98757]|uniref:Uncharacterized protein n=1 Tax=Haloechinothrix aidingensis TaxID=2752311 RepID=A0A838AA35_9PSEU|nr:DUF5703 family protein [Haloechinothrix aidingensis]MBA0125882.1 hypothetical protein [Haloechinothrix aidingensis]